MKTTFTQGRASNAHIQGRILLLFVLFLSGFQSFNLYAQGPHTPKSLAQTEITQSRQAEFTFGFGSGIEGMSAYSFAPHCFAFGQFGIYRGPWDRMFRYPGSPAPSGGHRKDIVLRSGLGFYFLTPSLPVNRWELLLGSGVGQIELKNFYKKDHQDYFLQKSNSQHVFAQLNAGQVNEKESYTLGMRLSYIQFTQAKAWIKETKQIRDFTEVRNIKAMTFDVTGTLRQKVKNFQIQLQGGISQPLLEHKPKYNSLYQNGVSILGDMTAFRLIGSASVVYNINIPRRTKSTRSN